MGSVKYDGVDQLIEDQVDEYTWLISGQSLVLVKTTRMPLRTSPVAVGGAYYSNGGSGRWITALFSPGHVVGDILTTSEVRGWVITEKQSSINAYSVLEARQTLSKLLKLSGSAKVHKDRTLSRLLVPEVDHVACAEALWII